MVILSLVSGIFFYPDASPIAFGAGEVPAQPGNVGCKSMTLRCRLVGWETLAKLIGEIFFYPFNGS